MIGTVLIILAILFAALAIFSVPDSARWAGVGILCLALYHLLGAAT